MKGPNRSNISIIIQCDYMYNINLPCLLHKHYHNSVIAHTSQLPFILAGSCNPRPVVWIRTTVLFLLSLNKDALPRLGWPLYRFTNGHDLLFNMVANNTYSFKCLDAILAAIRDVHTLCLNIKSAFLITANQEKNIIQCKIWIEHI